MSETHRSTTDTLDGRRRIALLGSYVPRQCGIATFTKDLRDALASAGEHVRTLVLAMDDIREGYTYPVEVQFQLRQAAKRDYVAAADLLNISRVDIAVVQHEYGIYGGPDSSHVLELMTNLRMPIITTLHTVLTEPSPGQAKVMREIARLSDRLVVMSHLAGRILHDVYDVPEDRIAFIPHGIPDVPFVDPTFYKDQFGLEGRTVLLTFGLLSPGKGIEIVIRALPQIVAKHPDLVYVVLGATHPNVFKQEGNAYRDSLELLAEKLGVKNNLVFHNRYVSLDELCGYIGAADVYVIPYLNKAQITSGTLAYAMGAGKAVVSTPFWYAEELLADGRGRLVPFGDPGALADTVVDLLDSDMERNAIRKRAYHYGRDMVWAQVGESYLRLAEEVLAMRRYAPQTPFFLRQRTSEDVALPDVSLAHVRALTDDTGICQHSLFSIPDRFHGYCTDDNARALMALLMHYDLYRDESVIPLVRTYLSFLHHAYNGEAGQFRNFMGYDRRWMEEVGSEDCQGRAIWALGIATALAPHEGLLNYSARLFQTTLTAAEHLESPRAWAFVLIGIHAYLRRFDGDTRVRRLRSDLAHRIFDQFKQNAAPDWPWPEDVLSYANAKLPHAMILSGQWLPDRDMVDAGLRALEWLLALQLRDDGTVSLIGNQGWMTRSGERAAFDQQPVDAMALVEACAEAYRCTQDPVWRSRAHQCLRWFLGNNDRQSIIYDHQTGGCRDGLGPMGASLNEGAESTLAWIIALLTVNDLSRSAMVAEEERKARPVTKEAVGAPTAT